MISQEVPWEVPVYRRWRCALCGEDVIEGQRFFFIPGRGYAHVECIYEAIARGGALSRDVVALMDANEVLSYAIVRLKEAARIAGDEEVREALVKARHAIEDLAEELERVMFERAGFD